METNLPNSKRIILKEGYRVKPMGNRWERLEPFTDLEITLRDIRQFSDDVITILNPDFQNGPYIDLPEGPMGTFEVKLPNGPDDTETPDPITHPDGYLGICTQSSAWGAYLHFFYSPNSIATKRAAIRETMTADEKAFYTGWVQGLIYTSNQTEPDHSLYLTDGNLYINGRHYQFDPDKFETAWADFDTDGITYYQLSQPQKDHPQFPTAEWSILIKSPEATAEHYDVPMNWIHPTGISPDRSDKLLRHFIQSKRSGETQA